MSCRPFDANCATAQGSLDLRYIFLGLLGLAELLSGYD